MSCIHHLQGVQKRPRRRGCQVLVDLKPASSYHQQVGLCSHVCKICSSGGLIRDIGLRFSYKRTGSSLQNHLEVVGSLLSAHQSSESACVQHIYAFSSSSPLRICIYDLAVISEPSYQCTAVAGLEIQEKPKVLYQHLYVNLTTGSCKLSKQCLHLGVKVQTRNQLANLPS